MHEEDYRELFKRIKMRNLTKQTEREFKFKTNEKDLFRRIIEKKQVAGFLFDQIKDHAIKDMYFDSKDLDLYFHKAGLRLRKEENFFLISFKKHVRIKKGFFERKEIEQHLTSIHYENALVEMKGTEPYQLALIETYQKSLVPILEISVNRKSILLRKEKNEIEICLDQIQYVRDNPFRFDYEVEIELKKGDVLSINDVAKELYNEFSLLQSKSSKYKKGLEVNSFLKEKK